jgi:NAD(P)-dependent dehydrogenase (short-subunit alcohol dehydrogenase family)
MSDIKKVALVTGASQGLGEGIVQGFRARGYGVVGTSRSIQPSTDPDWITVAGDIGDPETGKRVVAAALEKFGRIDTLVNNAGVFIGKPFADYTEEDYRLKLRTNLDGFFFTTQQVIPVMLKQGSGHLVQITASTAEFASSRSPAILAMLTKGGLNSATKALAIEYVKQGIRVNAVAPGVIRTPMHRSDNHAALAAFHPMNRMGEIEDIVRAVLYLEDAAFSTGEILHVDGGLIAGR